ncbi:MAG: hypothetical protein L6R36_001343 [Xanthoria steineri]|nr:MAG: hypothetical protein L6R36_001343 [Xanthoria steineri]
MPAVSYVLATAVLVLVLVSSFLRLLYVLPAFNPTIPHPRPRGQPTRLLVVLGSGGHTSEMFSLLRDLDPNLYTHRSYIVSGGDSFSASKAVDFERALETKRRHKQGTTPVPSTYDISVIPRARRIHQPLWTTPVSSLRCLVACFALLGPPRTRISWRSDINQHRTERLAPGTPPYTYPDLIIANGPATAVLVIAASLLLRFLKCRGTEGKMRTIYVESWARVNSLSLSGRILVACGMVDRMLVQWENLSRKGLGDFIGALI